MDCGIFLLPSIFIFSHSVQVTIGFERKTIYFEINCAFIVTFTCLLYHGKICRLLFYPLKKTIAFVLKCMKEAAAIAHHHSSDLEAYLENHEWQRHFKITAIEFEYYTIEIEYKHSRITVRLRNETKK